jgi:hypothetical protein
VMRLEEFIDQVCREQPETLSLHELASVHPAPWVTRRGSGKQTRTRMAIGQKVWYERQAGDEVWHRVDDGSEFDIINPVAA